MLDAVGEPGRNQLEPGPVDGFGHRAELVDDVAAFATLVEHALDPLNLTGDATQPLADIVHHFFGQLDASLPPNLAVILTRIPCRVG